jgi:hypothetical protein
VLLACAQDGQRRPSLEATLDLLKGAARMWMRPRPGQPRTVFVAIRLMWAGALAELGVAITILATLGSVRAAVLNAYPLAWPAMQAGLIKTSADAAAGMAECLIGLAVVFLIFNPASSRHYRTSMRNTSSLA